MQVKHAFTSAVPDQPDATLIRPSNWNADHTMVVAAAGLVGADAAGPVAEITVGTGLLLSAGTLTSTGLTQAQVRLLVALR